jgi:metallo-beta-lactamase family protein
MNLELSFHGGAGTVTGSRHLLTAGNTRVLVDAGLFQGLKELRELNWQKPSFDPEEVDHLLLTHTHIDHAGYLPRLVKDGYQGPVHATAATAELAELLLMDSAKIQEEDADYANRKGFSKHRPALPLYTAAEATAALQLFRPTGYGKWLDLGSGVRALFRNIGHILGSSMIEIRVSVKRTERVLVFSGDVGRYGAPLHLDPDPLPPCDVLVIESTYGNRQHSEVSLAEQVQKPFQRTFARGGVVLIPSFAVGRAQLLTLVLNDLMRAGTLPQVPIHIDSPMAVNATEIYGRHLRDRNLDKELVTDGESRLFPPNVQFHRSVKESQALNNLSGPRVIISASGMLTAGRVLHHLRRLLPEGENLVVLAGYQAAGTRGRALLEGARSLKIHGERVPVRANFFPLHGMSAHADSEELLRWVRSAGKPPQAVFVTHGEPEASLALAQRLEREGLSTFVPRLGEAFDLLPILAG